MYFIIIAAVDLRMCTLLFFVISVMFLLYMQCKGFVVDNVMYTNSVYNKLVGNKYIYCC